MSRRGPTHINKKVTGSSKSFTRYSQNNGNEMREQYVTWRKARDEHKKNLIIYL